MWWIDRIGRRLLSFCLVACAFCLCAYLLFCDQVGRLEQVDDATVVTLAGRATECQNVRNTSGPGVYKLQDPTGETYVVTRVGVPSEAALLVIRGNKQTKNGHTVIVEDFSIGSF